MHTCAHITRSLTNSMQCIPIQDMVKYNENLTDLDQSQNLLESKFDQDPCSIFSRRSKQQYLHNVAKEQTTTKKTNGQSAKKTVMNSTLQ